MSRTLSSFLCLGFMVASSLVQAQTLDIWLGTSNGGGSQGIYHCTLDTATGKLSASKLAAEINGPGFLALHPALNVLYAVGNLERTPVVAAYSIAGTGESATLTLLDSAPIGDGGAAHVSVDPTGKMLLTAQYGGGSTAAFKLDEQGKIIQQTALINHEGGSGVVEDRQNASHAHWTGFSPDNKFAFVPDLGLDRVVIYKVDLNEASLEPHGFGEVPPGGGPRHMKFSTNGKWIYVLNELALSVSVFDYDAATGTMTIKQTIPTVSEQEKAQEQFKSCSEIVVHPSGKFVYAANRGHDTVTVFKVAEDGTLTEVQNEHVRGATPRNINLDPSANWLLAGGQDSHTLACFAVDPATGKITYNRSIINTPAPICILFGRQ